MSSIRIVLTEDNFRTLVSGNVVSVTGEPNVEICLTDLGFAKMKAILDLSPEVEPPRVGGFWTDDGEESP